jgi:N-acetylmuramoyl-L-alanine amidase
VFCGATEAALATFQAERGLEADGRCDEPTWHALIEAGWTLGDRLLMLRAPHLRGDDVAALQQGLNHLGFDCGRPDGIFGQLTARALDDFQRNSGLTRDGICGRETIQMLERVSRQSGSGRGVAWIRETEAMTRSTSLGTLRIVIGQFGGLSAIGRSITRSLRALGATVMATDEYEASAHAAAANRFGAAAYIGFEARADARSFVSYFAVPSFESVGGRSLATHIVGRLTGVLPSPPELRGMRLPVLRETRMPAVLCSLGPVREVADASTSIAVAVVGAVSAWSITPLHVPDA